MQPVTIYTTPFCGFCARAKQLLDAKSVSYTEIKAGMDAVKKREMMERAGGQRTFPQIFVGDTHVGGCDELHALERSGKLDPLLEGAG